MKVYPIKIASFKSAQDLQETINDCLDDIANGVCDCPGPDCVSSDPSAFHSGEVKKIISHQINNELWFFVFYDEVGDLYLNYDEEERE